MSNSVTLNFSKQKYMLTNNFIINFILQYLDSRKTRLLSTKNKQKNDHFFYTIYPIIKNRYKLLKSFNLKINSFSMKYFFKTTTYVNRLIKNNPFLTNQQINFLIENENMCIQITNNKRCNEPALLASYFCKYHKKRFTCSATTLKNKKCKNICNGFLCHIHTKKRRNLVIKPTFK